MADIAGNPTPLNVPTPLNANGTLTPRQGSAAQLERREVPPAEPVAVPRAPVDALPYDALSPPGVPVTEAGPLGDAFPYDVVPPPGVPVMPFVAGLAPDSIIITPANTSISAGNSFLYTATGIYRDGSHVNITTSVAWTSSDHSLATFSPDGAGGGAVTGHNGGGSVVITATLFGV